MAADVFFESVCIEVTKLNKAQVIDRILHFDGPVPLDFTEEFLDRLDLDKLRHILLAAIVTAQRKCVSARH